MSAEASQGPSVQPTPQRTPPPIPEPTAGASPEPSTQATPDATQSPVPATQPPELARSAIVEQDGVRVRINLARNPLPLGKSTSAEMIVTNTGPDDLIWFHDGCAILAHLAGSMQTERWRFGAVQVDPQKVMFKRYLVGTRRLDGAPISIRFVPKKYLNAGSIICADIGLGDSIQPGESMREKVIWDGTALLRLGLPPPGQVNLVATFASYWRKSEGPPDEGPGKRIDVPIDAWITGERDDRLLHPGEVVDAALSSAEFSSWLATVKIADGNEPVLWFDRAAGLWDVGNLDYGTEQFHFARVDPVSGAIVDTLDRAWDYAVDGQP
jgi:hypothetical protein